MSERFVARWHYLDTPHRRADAYAAEDREGRTLALLGFSAAAWKTAPRDAFIGWSPQVREKNLQYVIDNSRYLILPWVRIPNLASHILSEARRQLPQDWYDRYKVAPVLMETFVEIRASLVPCTRPLDGSVLARPADAASTTAKTLREAQKAVWLWPLRKDWKRTPNRETPGPATTVCAGRMSIPATLKAVRRQQEKAAE